jgi:hypothetical protein
MDMSQNHNRTKLALDEEMSVFVKEKSLITDKFQAWASSKVSRHGYMEPVTLSRAFGIE